MLSAKETKRAARHARIRKTVKGTGDRPRLAIFRSLSDIYAQLIDDDAKKTIAGTSSLKVKKGTKVEQAKEVGTEIAKLAAEKGIKEVVFDRGGYQYHGRVKALADSAREGGLKF